MGGYAILGWGSLIWDLDDLAPKVAGGWALGAGPALAMEFSRISPKRKGALVVVLDPDHGAPCPTHAIASCRRDIGAAIADLAARERCMPERIGAVCRASGLARSARPGIAGQIADWCAAEGWQGAVWTDLPVNFAETTGTPFSVEAGLDYLAALGGDSRAEAVRYIAQAPAATDTRLRRALVDQAWWRAALDAALAAGEIAPPAGPA